MCCILLCVIYVEYFVVSTDAKILNVVKLCLIIDLRKKV
jgi:hypothetical protein